MKLAHGFIQCSGGFFSRNHRAYSAKTFIPFSSNSLEKQKKKRRNQQQQNRKNRHSSFVFLLCYFEMFTSVSFVFYFHIKRRKYFTLARARPWQCAYVAYSCAACVCVLCVQHSKRDSSNHFRNEATELSRMH